MKVFFDSLGCPKALVDAERMVHFSQNAGNTTVFTPEDADVIVVNTCGFIKEAQKESIDAILRYAEMKNEKPELKIVVAGCLTERFERELSQSIPEADVFFGVKDPQKILDALKTNPEKHILSEQYRDDQYIRERSLIFSPYLSAYIKISEGCNRSCTFCSIPIIRGTQRSRKTEDIVSEAQYLRDEGVRELIVIAEDTTAYGTDIYSQRALVPLLEKLLRLDFEWVRLMYLFPDPKLEEIVQLMNTYKNFCRYIDIPLQHASAKILSAMNRPGDSNAYLNIIDRFRSIVPDIAIRSAFISGFPGETQEDHEILSEFLTEAKLNRVGFFQYSRERDTASYPMKPNVPVRVVKERIRELATIQQEISRNVLDAAVGKTIRCKSEAMTQTKRGREWLTMRSEFDAPEIDGLVYVPVKGNASEIEFADVRITKRKGNYDLTGEISSNG